MDEAISHIVEVDIMLVHIHVVDRLRTMVLLLDYNLNVRLNLFGILVVSHRVDLKAPHVSCKLDLDDVNRHLLSVDNVQLRGAGPSTRLLHALHEPVLSSDLAVFSPQIQRYDSMQGKLTEKDLTK